MYSGPILRARARKNIGDIGGGNGKRGGADASPLSRYGRTESPACYFRWPVLTPVVSSEEYSVGLFRTSMAFWS